MFEIGQLTRLPLGYVGENGTRTISIDMKAWLDEYPGALIMIQVIRPVDHYKYPAAYTKTDGVIRWTVDGSEVMYAGKGLAQIALYNPDTKQEYKSRVVGTIVAESLDGFNDIMMENTDPASKWVNQVLEAAESAEASKNDAANSKEEAEAAIAIVAMQKNEALIAIQNEGAAQVVSVNDAGTQQAQFVEAKGEEVLGKIPEDYTELSNNVAALTEEIARETAPPIIPTATGEVVSVSDSANRPLAGLRLYGKTTQDGVPSPNSPVPLVSAGAGGSIWVKAQGKNLLPNTVSTTVNNGITFSSNTDGTITANGTSLADWDAYCIVGTATLVVGEKYILTGCPSGGGFGIGLDGTGIYDWGNGIEFTAETANYTAVLIVSKNKTVSGIVFSPMIRLASDTNAAFEPYKDGGSLTASTPNGLPDIPVTSGGSYTDANGQQWVCDEIDFGRGVYVQRLARCALTNFAWVKASDDQQTANTTLFYANVADKKPGVDNVVSDRFLSRQVVGSINDHQGICGHANYSYIYLRIAGVYDADDFDGWLATAQPCMLYACATPIETPLSTAELEAYRAMTSQYPNTTVYNDAGAGMAVDYIADTQRYIDKKLAAIAAATL